MGEAKLKRRKIYLAIPCGGGSVDIHMCRSLFDAQKECFVRGWDTHLDWFGEIHAIHIVRNLHVNRFLKTDCTDLFFIDRDIGFAPGAIIRMVEHPVDVVCGLYRLKDEKPSFALAPDADGSVLDRDADTGLYRIRGTGAGFMRIRRAVIEKMVAACHPEKWYYDRDPNEKLWPLFYFGIRDHQFIGEDVWFADRWAELGGTVWGDGDLNLHHIGQKAYSGSLNSFMDRRAA